LLEYFLISFVDSCGLSNDRLNCPYTRQETPYVSPSDDSNEIKLRCVPCCPRYLLQKNIRYIFSV